MNLEAIEQRALAFLEEASNPLVRIEVLHAHLVNDVDAAGLSVGQLKSFLSRHELVRVIEPPLGAFAPGSEPGGAYAIARERVPTQLQLLGMMREQLDLLIEALRTAREEALAFGDATRLSQIDEAQRKAASLRERLESGRPDNIVDFRQN